MGEGIGFGTDGIATLVSGTIAGQEATG